MIRLRATDHAEVAAAAFIHGEQRATASANIRAAAHPHKQIARDARPSGPFRRVQVLNEKIDIPVPLFDHAAKKFSQGDRQ